MDYIEVKFENAGADVQELLIGHLAPLAHLGMLEEPDSLCVYFNQDEMPHQQLREVAKMFQIKISFKPVQNQDWNQKWEQSVLPVVIDDFCAVRPDFHPPVADVQYDLIVTPKMSFGTGHHATTYLMIQMIAHLDLKAKTVLDFGCGTGVLAILAEKRGATKIQAIDIDAYAIENAKENCAQNACCHIQVENVNLTTLTTKFDCIFANITRNILMENMEMFHTLLNSEGHLLLSGILEGKDEDIINRGVKAMGFHLIRVLRKDKWVAFMFQK